MAAFEQLIDDLESRYREVQERMSDPAVYNDRREAAEVGRRLKELEEPYRLAQDWRATHDDAEAAKADPDLRELLPDVEVIAFDLPHHHGAGEVLHLMSFLSPLDVDLAVVYLPLMPVRLVELLRERGIGFVEVPDEEFESMGPNVLALAPRVALALEGNDETRRRMEAAGVDVRSYKGDEISRKGDGGPTCLTRPLLRS